MNAFVPLVVGVAILLIASRTYPFFLGRLLGLDNTRQTPAHRLEDGKDYVPTRSQVVFAHHFAVIAGAGPIVGPTMALAFGFGAPWLWVIIGCILFGAVHDMVTMFISMREDGKSMAEMSRRTLGTWGYFLFLGFLIMVLTLITAVFLNLSCGALTADYPLTLLQLSPDSTLLHIHQNKQGIAVGRIGGIATTSVFIITLIAPFFGWLIYKRKTSALIMYPLAFAACVLSVIAGFYIPLFLEADQWRWIMSAYVFIACWIPVWLVLQPRDFVNVQILYAGVLVMIVGVAVMGWHGTHLNMAMWAVQEGTALAGPIWPTLLITVACGAISGFHSLASTGTTVKQISQERDVRRVGYYAMILEGVLAIATLALIASALSKTEYASIVYPEKGVGNPILAFAVAMGYMLHTVFNIPIAVGAVLGILVVEGFVVTTLDTAVRLSRYMFEELWRFLFTDRLPKKVLNVMLHPLFNTFLSVVLMLFVASMSTINSIWKIFGTGNQLIAALSMTVASVWLLQRGRKCWYVAIPAVLMTITTFGMLIVLLWNNRVGAAVGPLTWKPAEKGLLATACCLLLALGVGVLIIGAKAIADYRGGRLLQVPVAVETEPVE
jgi:carbon starvation protein